MQYRDSLLETVLQSVFFYDDLTLLQTHDFLGYSYRVVQAKKAGLIPPEVIVKITCHASQCCLEAAHEYWTPVSNLHILHREKEAIEKVDVLTFPTQYLRNLYLDRGYDLSGPPIEMHPHPWTGDSDEVPEDYLPIDTLIFFGRRQTLKGYPDFLAALRDIAREKMKTSRCDRISRVIFLGELVTERPEDHDLLDELRQTLEITENALPRVAALELLKEERHRSLVVLPYRGDNHPWCVLECIYLSCQFLGYEAGGIPEMIPQEHRQSVLCKPTPGSLTPAIQQLLGWSGEQRRELVAKLKDSVSAMRIAVNDLLKERYESGYSKMVKMQRRAKLNSDLVSIIVPAYNTPMRYIADLCRGINSQTLQPKEVIFVDDGSEHGFVSQLESELCQSLKAPYQVISQHNGGVAAARNTGWLNATTEYVVAHDDDNILKPDFLWIAVDYLESNPTVAAVTSYFEQFEDGKGMEFHDSDRYIYKPLFNSLIMSLNDNHLGDAMGCYRRDILQAVGGWDDADRSKWEDWALYLRLISCGHRIGLINSCQFLYRWRAGSMARIANKYAAECRLARSVYTLPRFDAFDLKRLAADNLRKQNELASLENEPASLKYRVARKLTEQLNRLPLVKRLLKYMLLHNSKMDRHLKRN